LDLLKEKFKIGLSAMRKNFLRSLFEKAIYFYRFLPETETLA
jgi:hypothetical protein